MEIDGNKEKETERKRMGEKYRETETDGQRKS